MLSFSFSTGYYKPTAWLWYFHHRSYSQVWSLWARKQILRKSRINNRCLQCSRQWQPNHSIIYINGYSKCHRSHICIPTYRWRGKSGSNWIQKELISWTLLHFIIFRICQMIMYTTPMCKINEMINYRYLDTSLQCNVSNLMLKNGLQVL